MRRINTSVIAICLALGLVATSPTIGRAQDETIKVAPDVLVISSHGTKVTIHSNIPAGTVNVSTLELSIDGIGHLTPISTFADARGQLVAKFDMEEVKGLVAVPSAELTLYGVYFEGGDFSATDVIEVKE
jgi:hypothetical protein